MYLISLKPTISQTTMEINMLYKGILTVKLGIEKVVGTEIYRKVIESFWMKKLNTLESDGLNTQYER
jgi:hypothetical protein